ncbi:Uncharacterised protein [Serratia odorifera]|uniref:Uncharacterized protein n=1 Tax=Serratia odorifera TaxID=618 RepID=A0A3S4DBC2_SEROD|nr:hypothetical protein [Serratia odorifera]VDZ51397.1 Uncharacterised protein [Serratia odorifera]
MSVDWHDGEAPGIRLTQSVMPDGDAGARLSSALPAFIGGHPAITGARQAVNTTGVYFVPVATWEQWPWRYRPGEWCLADTVRHYFDNGGGPCFVLTAPEETTSTDQAQWAWWDTFIGTASTLLLREPAITLVAAPQLSLLSSSPVGEHVEGEAEALVLRWQALLQACASRPDLFFVLDAAPRAAGGHRLYRVNPQLECIVARCRVACGALWAPPGDGLRRRGHLAAVRCRAGRLRAYR